MLVLIDADPIVYRCGFAAEKTEWNLIYEDKLGNPQEVQFAADDKGTAGDYMKDWLAFHHDLLVLCKDRMVSPDPVSFALRAVKVQVESIMRECSEHYSVPSPKMRLFLSGGKNYRDAVAKVRPYKGNRDATHKPFHYQTIRDYLQAQYGALITNGIEADDAVSITCHNNLESPDPEHVVIATIDKDLDQIPGDHYNYMQKVFYAVNEAEAEEFFWYQVLRGDITDNIVGVWRCGDTAAKRIVGELPLRGHVASVDHLRRDRGVASGADGSGANVNTGGPASSVTRPILVRSRSQQRRLSVQRPELHTRVMEPGNRAAGDGLLPSGHDAVAAGEPVSVSAAPAPLGAGVPADGAGASGGVESGAESGATDGGVEQLPSGVDSADSGTASQSVHVHGNEPGPVDTDGGAAGGIQRRRRTDLPVKRGHGFSTRHEAVWRRVVSEYAASQRKPGCPYAAANPEAVAIEMAQLVKLQEYPGQLWHPFGDLVVPGFGTEDFDNG